MSETRNNAFWGWLVPALVAVGLFFSIATHLRVLTGGAVGPGEMLLLAAAVLGWAFGKPWQQLKNPILWFWGLLAVTMALGFLTGNLQGHWVMRNTQAYVFTGFVVIGLVTLLRYLSDEALRRCLALLALIAAAGMWVGFVVYLIGDPALIQKFALNDMGDVRYAGWSENPNQLALFFIPLPVWLAALWRDVLKPPLSQTVGFGLLLLALMLMGLLVRSDGLFVVWVFEFAVLLVLRLRWDLKVSRMSLFGYAMAMVLCVLLIKTFAHGEVRKSFHCATQAIAQGINPLKSGCYQGAFDDREFFRIGYSDPLEKTGIRGELWRNGVEAWLEAPLFGHGPGAFSWYTNPDYQRDAEAQGKFREESHNIPIDLLTQGGPLLAMGWCALLLYLLVGAWRARDSYTFSVVLMIGVFTLFHYHIRQPYLWFALIMSYQAIRRRLFVGGRRQGA